ncbi:hypothetical protein ACQKFG_05655 [Peribacillus sp. NPDC076916]|uniref:hypothetical protein n=1 Tax=Peribacillus sp. NPDC076916 TaxID=3390608 RepID=UPI003CFD49D2
MNNKQLIEEYLREKAPTAQLDVALAFAEVKARYGALQKDVASILGINDRSLRQYISNNKEEYEARLTELQAEIETEIDYSKLNTRVLSEEQIDKFVENVFKKATSKDASVREWEFFLNFTGLTATEVLNLQEAKAKTLRYWIKAQVGMLKQFMNTRTLGLMTESSSLIYRGAKGSKDNAQNFVNSSLEDESFKQELMYWGAVHLSMMNNVEHPDLELLATAVRVDRIEKDIPEVFDKYEVRRYAEGDFTPRKSDKTLDEMMLDLYVMEHGATRGAEEYEKAKANRQDIKPVVKPPELDKVDVELRASKYEEELQVLLTTAEEMQECLKT